MPSKSSPRAALMRTPIIWVMGLTILAAGVFILLCGVIVLNGKWDAEQQADVAADNMARAIEQDVARNFELFDLSLQGVIAGLQQPEFASLTGKVRQLALFDNSIKATYLNGVIVLDENGDITEDSTSVSPRKANFADRPFFRAQRDNPNLGLYVSAPVKGYLNGEWVISISRRISKPDGSFAGVVSGTVQTEYFQNLFSHLSVGEHGSLQLFLDDGQLVAGQPLDLRMVGEDYSRTALFGLYPAARNGRYESSDSADRVARRFTFQKIKDLPLVINVGSALSDIYAPWLQKLLFVAGLMAALLLTIVTLLITLSREVARRKHSEERYRLLTDNSSDAIILRDIEGHRKYATPAFYAIIGRSPEEMSTRRLAEFLDDESREMQARTLERLRAGEQMLTDVLRYCHPDGTWAWLEVTCSSVLNDAKEIVVTMRDVSSRKAAEDALAVAAATDGMTGIANRRSFDEALDNEWKRALRSHSHIAILMIDVDYFKAYNDRFGHARGDEALKLVATCITANASRPGDLSARYGGEEFAVILADADTRGALEVAEKIRRAIAALDLRHPDSPSGVVTISIGLTSQQPRQDDLISDMLRSADIALYQAKRNGRNRTEQAIREAPPGSAELRA